MVKTKPQPLRKNNISDDSDIDIKCEPDTQKSKSSLKITKDENQIQVKRTRATNTSKKSKYIESSSLSDSDSDESIKQRHQKKKNYNKKIAVKKGLGHEKDSSSESGVTSSDQEKPPKRRCNVRPTKNIKRTRAVVRSSDSDSLPVPVKKTRKKIKNKKGGKDNESTPGGRKRIRTILRADDLREETKDAEKQEEMRRQRLKDLASKKSVQVDLEEDELGSDPIPVTKRLILQKEPLVEVHPRITVHLKPHQVEGIQFMWDNLIESTAVANEQPGGGCILAHCMGLGKTLQTITVVHTILNCKELSFKTVLVVAPLNTLLNWIAEFVRWVPDETPVQLYNLTEYTTKKERLKVLKTWQEKGGVMVVGYDLFRLLATGKIIRHKPYRVLFQEALLNPGPDIIICDEGHKLKNSEANISKTMNQLKSQRRVVLTGTPLQNNLNEYQCMVNFVKKDLLGSIKEFRNRFVNPIINGQHKDSNKYDVRLMKNRCHILHEMLSGFVQRKDYTALAQYLCEKHEYILKVRLSPLQIKLYRHYLDSCTSRGSDSNAVERSKDNGLFSDYQSLMLVWTHPKVLRMHTRRREIELMYRITDESDVEEARSTDSDGDFKLKDNDTTEKTNDGAEIKPVIPASATNGDLASEESDNGCKDPTTSSPKKQSKPIKYSDDEDGDEEEEEIEEDATSSDSWDSNHSDSPDAKKPLTRAKNSSRYPLRGIEDQKEKRKTRSRVFGGNSGSSDEEEESKPDKFNNSLADEPDTWYSDILAEEGDTYKRFEAGSKIMVLFEILRMARECNDKVLVFSQSLLSLDLIEQTLAISTAKAVPRDALDPDPPASIEEEEEDKLFPPGFFQTWYKNVDYFRMDGSSLGKSRHRWINEFNDVSDERARLFLISTKAGSLGVNLVAANRVVIFDVSWNPSHDIQSIFRVYRFGQTKTCYVYRLIAQGTMEEKIYDRQVTKQSLAFRVVDEQQINRHFTAHDLQELYTLSAVPAPDDDKDLPAHTLPKDQLLAELLVGESTKKLICSYHQHDSLLDHQETEALTEEERKAAWEEYENEKTSRQQSTHAIKQFHIQQQQMEIDQRFVEQGAAGTNIANLKFFQPNFDTGVFPAPLVRLFQYHANCGGPGRSAALNASDVREIILPCMPLLPVAQQKTANSCLNVMMKASYSIEQATKRIASFKNVDIEQLVETLKPLPMYRNMAEASIRMLALEVQIRQQNLRLAAEKELKNNLLQLKWFETRFMKHFYSVVQSNEVVLSALIGQANGDVASASDSSQLQSASAFARSTFAKMIKDSTPVAPKKDIATPTEATTSKVEPASTDAVKDVKKSKEATVETDVQATSHDGDTQKTLASAEKKAKVVLNKLTLNSLQPQTKPEKIHTLPIPPGSLHQLAQEKKTVAPIIDLVESSESESEKNKKVAPVRAKPSRAVKKGKSLQNIVNKLNGTKEVNGKSVEPSADKQAPSGTSAARHKQSDRKEAVQGTDLPGRLRRTVKKVKYNVDSAEESSQDE